MTESIAVVQLDCGHEQRVSTLRMTIASNGEEQHQVFCVACNDWQRLAPFVIDKEGD